MEPRTTGRSVIDRGRRSGQWLSRRDPTLLAVGLVILIACFKTLEWDAAHPPPSRRWPVGSRALAGQRGGASAARGVLKRPVSWRHLADASHSTRAAVDGA